MHQDDDKETAPVEPRAHVAQVTPTLITINSRRYQVAVNHKDAVDTTRIGERYDEILGKYDFIVGDWGYEQLRLKASTRTPTTRPTRTSGLGTCRITCSNSVTSAVRTSFWSASTRLRSPWWCANRADRAPGSPTRLTSRATAGTVLTGGTKTKRRAASTRPGAASPTRKSAAPPAGRSVDVMSRSTQPVRGTDAILPCAKLIKG